MGRKKRPFYRIVVTDSRTPRDGRYIECIGTYDPITDPPKVKVVEEKANYWLDRGAIPTDTVKSLLRHQGVIYKRYLRKKGYEEAKIEEEIKKWEVLQIERQRRKAAKAQAKKKEKAKTEPEGETSEVETKGEEIASNEEEEKVEMPEEKKEETENKVEENNPIEKKDKGEVKDEKVDTKEAKVNEERGVEEGKSTDE